MTETPRTLPHDDAFATRWSRIHRLHDDGAEEAWRWFIDRYDPEIRAMLRRRVPMRLVAHAESEFWGYLYVSRAVTRAESDRRFRPYLAGVVRNFARSWLRRHDEPSMPEDVLELIPASGNRDLEQEELRAWARHTVMLGLDSMTATYPTQANVLRWFYGLPDASGPQTPVPVTEIAARIGKNIAAVHQDLTRGRLRLRNCIEQELRDQSGSAAEWQAEMQLIFGALAAERPGLIPK